MVVLLDASPVGLLTNPRAGDLYVACNAWLQGLLARGEQVVLSEITDYEVRRELLRIRSTGGIRRLDGLKVRLSYLPLSTPVMLKAAEFWALARQGGRPTAPDTDLDCDMILAAQSALLADAGAQPLIATTNVRHLGLFADARRWQDIT